MYRPVWWKDKSISALCIQTTLQSRGHREPRQSPVNGDKAVFGARILIQNIFDVIKNSESVINKKYFLC